MPRHVIKLHIFCVINLNTPCAIVDWVGASIRLQTSICVSLTDISRPAIIIIQEE